MHRDDDTVSTPPHPAALSDRRESHDERLDRNFSELLQELRVLQTGTQILAGFLLTLPFQARFADLSPLETAVFLVAVSLAVLTTILFVSPVAVHRSLFRQHRKDQLVASVHVLTRVGLVGLALTMAAVLMLVFTVVLDVRAGIAAGAAAIILFVVLGALLPALLRRRDPVGT